MAWFVQALTALSVTAGRWATAACSSGSYTCSGEGRVQADHMTDLEGLTSVLPPPSGTTVTAGGGVFISFHVTDFDDAVAKLEGTDACQGGSLPEGESAQNARALSCTFPHSAAQLVVTRQPLGGEATPIVKSD